MTSGKRDRLITLLRPITTRGTDGASVTTYVDHATAWAAKRIVRSAESSATAGQLMPYIETLWTVPYVDASSVDASWRLRDEAGTLHALAAPPRELGRRDSLELPTVTVPIATSNITT